MSVNRWHTRRASIAEAPQVAQLLHDFNTEFDTPTPGVGVLDLRLRRLFAGGATYCILAGDPPLGVALVTLRPNVWFEGPVALVDEFYVMPGHRGQGVGSAIIEHLLTATQEMDCQLVEINVDEGDHDARRFYERHGFSTSDPESGELALHYYQEIAGWAAPQCPP